MRKYIGVYVYIGTPFYGSNRQELLIVGEMDLRESVRVRLLFFILDIFLGLCHPFFFTLDILMLFKFSNFILIIFAYLKNVNSILW